MEQGTGKTITTLSVIVKSFRRKKYRKILIVCPKTVISSWKRQTRKFLGIRFTFLDKYDALEWARTAQVERELEDNTLHILIINYELLSSLLRKIKFFKPHLTIFDESHKLKNRKSKQSKASHKVGRISDSVLLLTGTPIGGSDVDLYSQFTAMDESIFGKVKIFERVYTRKCGYMLKDRKIKSHKKAEFMKRIKNRAFYITKQEALDLPTEQSIYHYFDLSPKAKRHYTELEETLSTEWEGLEASSPIVVANMLKLQQLTGGFLKLDNGDMVQLEQDKLLLLMDIMDGFAMDKKIVIFARFTAEIEIIAKAMAKQKRSFGILSGKTKDKTIWEKFQDNKNPSVLIAQIASGGVGIDLFAADTAIFYSNSFNYIDYEQAKARLHRRGQTKKVSYIHLLANFTIDIDIKKVLDKKNQGALAILKQLKRRRLCLKQNQLRKRK